MPSLKYVLNRIDSNALLTDAEKDIRKEDARERHREKAQESQRIAETLRSLPPMESDAKIAERLADLRELHVARLELRGRAAELRCELAAGKITRAQAREAAERITREIARVEAPMLAQRRALGLPEVLDGDGAAERSEGQRKRCAGRRCKPLAAGAWVRGTGRTG